MKAKTTHTINTCAHVQIVHVKKQHNTCTLHVRVPVMCTSHMMCTTVPGTHVKWIFSSFKVFLDENTFIVPYRKKLNKKQQVSKVKKKLAWLYPVSLIIMSTFVFFIYMYICMCTT